MEVAIDRYLRAFLLFKKPHGLTYQKLEGEKLPSQISIKKKRTIIFKETLKLDWAASRMINGTDDETAGAEHIRFLTEVTCRLYDSINKTYTGSSTIKYIHHTDKLDYYAKKR